MTITPDGLLLYCGALVILFLTPGPVWVAIIARGLTGGFSGAWPLAVGVAIGDMVWPLAAIFGLSWLVFRYWERPFMALRDQIGKRLLPATPSS
jgi:threonine/homoserine/homoserine lactone efflux protein